MPLSEAECEKDLEAGAVIGVTGCIRALLNRITVGSVARVVLRVVNVTVRTPVLVACSGGQSSVIVAEAASSNEILGTGWRAGNQVSFFTALL